MKLKSLLLVMIAVGCFALVQAPHATTLLSAKKACLDNRTYASIGDTASARLKQWGRFELVSDPKAADVIFVFSLQQIPGKVLGSTGRGVLHTYIPTAGTTSMAVVDAKTRTILYSDARKWTHSTEARKLIDTLQKRMDKAQAGK
jgi:hypothetical protein